MSIKAGASCQGFTEMMKRCDFQVAGVFWGGEGRRGGHEEGGAARERREYKPNFFFNLFPSNCAFGNGLIIISLKRFEVGC